MSKLKSFLLEDNGVVTVEWVALAGSVLIGAIAVGWIVMNNLKAPASTVGTKITSCEVYAAQHGGSVTGC